VSGKTVTLTGLTTVRTGEGFPSTVTARAMSVKRIGGREDGTGGCTAMLVNRPLVDGVPAPTGVADMDDAMVRRVSALLSAHSDAEDVFRGLEALGRSVLLEFQSRGPMLHRRSLRRPRDIGEPGRGRGWTFAMPSSAAMAVETSSDEEDATSTPEPLHGVGTIDSLLPPELPSGRRMSWSTDGGGSEASFSSLGPTPGGAEGPPGIRARAERGLGSLDPPLDRLVALRCDAAARLLIRGSTFRGLTSGMSAAGARQALLLSLSQLRQIVECRITQSVRVPAIHWLAVRRAAKTRRLAAGLAVLRQSARDSDDDFAAPAGFAVAGPLRCDFSPALRALLRCRFAATALGVQQCLRDCLRQVEACVTAHAASLGLPQGRLEIAAEDKTAVVVHLLVAGARDDVIEATVDVGTVVGMAKRAEPPAEAAGAAGAEADDASSSSGDEDGDGGAEGRGGARHGAPRRSSDAGRPVWSRGRPLSIAQGGGVPDDVERGLAAATVVPDAAAAADPFCCPGPSCSRGAAGLCRAAAAVSRSGAYVSLDETRELTGRRGGAARSMPSYGAINSGGGSAASPGSVGRAHVVGSPERRAAAAVAAPGARAEAKTGAAGGSAEDSVPASAARRARAAVRRCRAAAATRHRSTLAEAEVAVSSMQLCGGTESLLPFLTFGCALGRGSDPSAAGMELGYAAATVMQAVSVVCSQAPWPATDDEELDEDGL